MAARQQLSTTSAQALAKLESKASDKVVVYLPDNTVRRGYASLVRDIATEMVDNRYLTYQLFRRDMVAFYKQSLLGAVWMLVMPLITVGTFMVLRGSGVVAVGELSAPYPIFATLGVAVWQLFAQGLVAGANSLVQGGDMITRINFSKKSLIVASLGRTVVSFFVLVALLLVLFAAYMAGGYQYSPSASLALLPLTLIPTLLLTVGLSFYLALINGVVRDVASVLSVVVTFLMLLTPVLYERPKLPEGGSQMGNVLATITEYNPLYYLISAPRDLVLRGEILELRGFLFAALGSLIFFLLALVGFHLAETRIAERI